MMLSISRPLATSKGGLHDKYAGQQAVPHKLVENIDLGSIIGTKHTRYRSHARRIFR